MREDGYAPISEYGFLSDCRSSALVCSDGSIDWLCWPRFDSPSIFARLLDAERGGAFIVEPTQPYQSKRRYLDNSNVLETTFTTETGVVVLQDWLHMGARQSLCRLLIAKEGQVELNIDCDARLEYGLHGPLPWKTQVGFLTAEVSDEMRLVLDGFQSGWSDEDLAEAKETITLKAGQKRAYTLSINRPGPSNISSSRDRALLFWRDWTDDMRLPRYLGREQVVRSALVLKGLQYAPSGAIIAAATTSLPERLGGDRNYDYRFSWLRDAVFALFALRSVDRHHEAESYFDWLRSIALRTGDSALKLMYGVMGESELPEETLDHLEGYKGSRPVRVGNAAADQSQLDTLGELTDAIWIHHRRQDDHDLSPHRWLLVRGLANRAAEEWQDRDHGIWEIRGATQHYVHSKVMCWVALDRAIRLSRKAPEGMITDDELSGWKENRDALKEEILDKGYSEKLQAFTLYYGSESLDAANLLLARLGFVKAKDPRFISTVKKIQEELGENDFVYRYDSELVDDEFRSGGDEGAFVICTLWMVLALIEIGELEEAERLFNKILSHSNDLGLYAEQLSPEGEQLGNFPQAFTHIAIIVTAFALDHAKHGPMERRPQPDASEELPNPSMQFPGPAPSR
jgi:GH15 family glucan-1,4-alpha-glucosidase